MTVWLGCSGVVWQCVRQLFRSNSHSLNGQLKSGRHLNLSEENAPESVGDLKCATEESNASRAARTGGPARRSHQKVDTVNNKLPGRPCTAFFTPTVDTSASSVFEAPDKAKISYKDILCLHRGQGGEVQITFRTKILKEKFIALNSIKINEGNYALQDVDRPLTFLTIYDAPYELPDLAIVKRLQRYCEVIHSRRGRYALRPSVCNGLRHYRVRIIQPIPSYLRFVSFLVQLQSARTLNASDCTNTSSG